MKNIVQLKFDLEFSSKADESQQGSEWGICESPPSSSQPRGECTEVSFEVVAPDETWEQLRLPLLGVVGFPQPDKLVMDETVVVHAATSVEHSASVLVPSR